MENAVSRALLGRKLFQSTRSMRHVLERVVQKPAEEAKPASQADEQPKKPAEASAVLKAIPVQEEVPQPSKNAKEKTHADVSSIVTSNPAHPAEPQSESNPLEQDTYLQQCIADLTRQLLAAPAKKGASVTPITLAGYKL